MFLSCIYNEVASSYFFIAKVIRKSICEWRLVRIPLVLDLCKSLGIMQSIFIKDNAYFFLARLILLGCLKFSQLPMVQHFHNIVSHPFFHLVLLLFHLYHTSSNILWSCEDEKFESHGSWNIFSKPKIDVIGCWVVRGKYMADTERWIIRRDYISAVMT